MIRKYITYILFTLQLFVFILPGYNVRATEIQGAAGMVQLNKIDEIS